VEEENGREQLLPLVVAMVLAVVWW